MTSRICEQLGIDFPLFAFSHCRDVVAAVTNAGGFGVLVLTLMVTSKGIAGVPGVSFVVLLATLGSVGIPLEGLAFIAGVDRILDMARTALNVVGNALAVLVIAKWEHKFDRKKALAYEREVLGKFDKTADQ